MSIVGLIRVAVARGQLFELKPQLESDPVARTMIYSKEIEALFAGVGQSEPARIRFQRLRADMEEFVKGGAVSICLEPFGARHEDFGLLSPPHEGLVDMRNRAPKPGLRLIGGFAKKDIYVALTCRPRSKPMDFIGYPPLGDGGSAQWADARAFVKAEWQRLFGNEPRVTGSDPNDYFTP